MTKLTPLKSGWLYLWLVLSLLCLVGDRIGIYAILESYNLSLLSQFKTSVLNTHQPNSGKQDNTVEKSTGVIRVITPKLKNSDTTIYQSLLDNYPNATIIFTSHLDQLSLDIVNQFASPQHKLVALSASSLTVNPISDATLLNQVFIEDINEKTWKAYANLDLAAQPEGDPNASQIILLKQDAIYPSLLLSGLVKYHQVNSTSKVSILKGQIQFDSNKENFRALTVGIEGKIYPLSLAKKTLRLSQLSEKLAKTFDGILLIDDQMSSSGENLHRAFNSLQQNNYLVTSALNYLFLGVIWFVLGYILFMLKRKSTSNQSLFIGLLALLLVVAQVFFSYFSLWLSVLPLLLLCFASLLICFGINQEHSAVNRINQSLNLALNESALEFLRTQKAKSLLELLQNCEPNEQLISTIREVATEAEAYQNTAVASQFYQWLISHNKNDKQAKLRLKELTKTNQPEVLDQTLVMDGNNSISQQAVVNNVLAIKNFGRYQVEGVLGKGAMGIVFQGVDPKINRHVAIKTLQLSDEFDDDSLQEKKQRFFREAETAGNLSHANIVTIYDVGEQQQQNSNQSLGYIAMDLLTGAPLSEFTKADKLLPPALVYQLMIQMTDALDYAHRQKVIHRDIKPANIIFDDDLQRGTLTDFGIAYMSDHSKTKTGIIMGSPYYMSPEQVMGQTVDGRSDIFSLGVTFYQLLSGHLPFNGESIATVAFNITKTKHESVRNLNKKLLTSSTRITNKALHKDPTKRYQTMQEFRQALINALKRDYKKSPL
jgi:eukaryotic-like serine/threonine-protein kinase